MEAIKCPNCGSEKCKELSEEKWVCLACDNVFLIHNLSKEFQVTDSHISDVHNDLSHKLDEIKNITGNTSAENQNLKELAYESERQLSEGDFLEAYQLFKKYSVMAPDSAFGYEGMFRALTDDYTLNVGPILKVEEETHDIEDVDDIFPCIASGSDVLKKALNCDDCNKEEILKKFLPFYQQAAMPVIGGITVNNKKDNLFLHIFTELKYNAMLEEGKSYGELAKVAGTPPTDNENKIYENDELKPFFQRAIELYNEDIEHSERRKKEREEKREKYKQEKAVFDAASEQEKKKRRLKYNIPFFIMLAITIILFVVHSNLTLKILFIVIDIVTALIAICGVTGPVDPYDEKREETEEKDKQKTLEMIEYTNKIINKIDEIETLSISDMEKFIDANADSVCPAQELYQSYLEDRREQEEEEEVHRQREEEILEGYYSVRVGNWGRNPKVVRDILMQHSSNPSGVKESYKNRESYTITGFRKSEAYKFQKELINAGAAAYVNKM